jgi:hypothetical protein
MHPPHFTSDPGMPVALDRILDANGDISSHEAKICTMASLASQRQLYTLRGFYGCTQFHDRNLDLPEQIWRNSGYPA